MKEICFLASEWLKFETIPLKYRDLVDTFIQCGYLNFDYNYCFEARLNQSHSNFNRGATSGFNIVNIKRELILEVQVL